ncbi:hypothetical protein DNTS_004658 [Danionella cerebrum]|uniref:UPAR/Ly6 domain-containing protein n=1 Tax=Danionella cerebrum TaxID=2873325 RepID=A0A553QYE0_9TELE|nr:hypothetical protein DNTS_004658 [Danionella translucida]
MVLQTSVFLLFLLVPAGHSLSCYECVGVTGSCADQKTKTCPNIANSCTAVTTVVEIADIKSKVMVKDCSIGCATGSMNFGLTKMSTTCCNTELCNLKDAPDPSTAAPNGKECFYCDEKSCTNILSCTGSDDQCITAKGSFAGQTTVVKGCASKSICDATNVGSVENFSCCSGNLCNDAKAVGHSFLFLCFSFLSFLILH